MEALLPLMLFGMFSSIAGGMVNTGLQAQANANNFDLGMKNYELNKENLEFMKAKQAEQWEREDTSYQRTKQDMLQAGLNPLTMQGTNGAGEVVSLPQLEAPQQQATQLPDFGSTVTNTVMQMEQAINGKLSRDSLQEQINSMKIKNARDLKNLGGYFDKNGKIIFGDGYKDYDWESTKLSYDDAKREYDQKVSKGYYDSDSEWERCITSVVDWLTSGRSKEQLEKLRKEYPWLDGLLTKLFETKEEKPKKKGLFGFLGD